MSLRAWSTVAGLAAAVALVLVIVLVVSGGDDSETSSSEPAAAAPNQEFQDCLADQGIEIPEGGPSGTPPSGGVPPSGAAPPSGGDMPQLPGGGDQAEAFEACSQYLPDDAGAGGFPAPPGG